MYNHGSHSGRRCYPQHRIGDQPTDMGKGARKLQHHYASNHKESVHVRHLSKCKCAQWLHAKGHSIAKIISALRHRPGHTCYPLDGLGQDHECGDIEERQPALDPVQGGVEERLKLVRALLGDPVQSHKRPHNHEHACTRGSCEHRERMISIRWQRNVRHLRRTHKTLIGRCCQSQCMRLGN